ncbi:hypothetical protein L210DRAFT_3105978 [Boletus edulis BED1]|uniref:Uncharacterized protein n=1 Tax=Boletus edulis BED1 TaxID=1328754 RepID=A0AAD4GHG8_BOLED|nr:hypothetical protein L210DRAFT_3105978 [Boletus edulis BED1]
MRHRKQLAQGHSPVLPLPPPNREGFGLKLILAYDQGVVCKLTAWRDTADAWRGLGPSPGLKRGKLVYFESTSSIPIDLMHICLIVGTPHGHLGNGQYRHIDRLSIQ